MGPDLFSSVFLEEYLEVCPKPALVLVSNRQPSPSALLKVCYSNRTFFEILGDNENFPAVRDLDGEASDRLSSILHKKCVHPTTSQLLEWIDAVMQDPSVGQDCLLTTFETTIGVTKTMMQEADTLQRTFVEIEWDVVVLQKKYILLTGKTAGIVSNGNGEKSTTNAPPPCPPLQRTPIPHATLPILPNTNYVPNNGAHATKAVSPGASGRNSVIELGRRTESFTTTYFTEQSPDSALSSPQGLDPWRHHEKANYIVILLKVDFETYRRRWDYGCDVT
jgi:hypothetical protein